MTGDSALAILVGGYFHQDVFDVYSDEFAAVDDFVTSDPRLGSALAADIHRALDEHPDDGSLARYLDDLGCDIEPGAGTTYREWLTQIADRVRAATA